MITMCPELFTIMEWEVVRRAGTRIRCASAA
jgi:hypothetical protein